MDGFESGVSSYVHARAIVDVFFPVDKRGNAEINCFQCYYFRRNYQTCGLNGEIVAFPNKFVGQCCPLKPEEYFNTNNQEDENEKI